MPKRIHRITFSSQHPYMLCKRLPFDPEGMAPFLIVQQTQHNDLRQEAPEKRERNHHWWRFPSTECGAAVQHAEHVYLRAKARPH